VDWVAHPVVFSWFMLAPYIDERRRAAGPWWSESLAKLTDKCLSFALQHTGEQGITLMDPDRGRYNDIVLDRNALQQMWTEVKRHLRRRSWKFPFRKTWPAV
jgi:hypothetical protein